MRYPPLESNNAFKILDFAEYDVDCQRAIDQGSWKLCSIIIDSWDMAAFENAEVKLRVAEKKAILLHISGQPFKASAALFQLIDDRDTPQVTRVKFMLSLVRLALVSRY